MLSRPHHCDAPCRHLPCPVLPTGECPPVSGQAAVFAAQEKGQEQQQRLDTVQSLQQSTSLAAQAPAATLPPHCAQPCPNTYAPICCDGRAYMNGCSAQCNGGVTDLGSCRAGRTCPTLEQESVRLLHEGVDQQQQQPGPEGEEGAPGAEGAYLADDEASQAPNSSTTQLKK